MTYSRREQVLDAACEMIAERGYRGTSLNAIAERVGLTRQGVLHYFPNKQHLLTAILDRETALGRGELPTDDVEPDLPDLFADVVARNRANPATARAYSVLMAESVTVDHPAREHFREHYQEAREQISDHLTERWGDRLPSGLSPQAAAVAILALIDGMQQQWLLDPGEADHPGTMHDVLALLVG